MTIHITLTKTISVPTKTEIHRYVILVWIIYLRSFLLKMSSISSPKISGFFAQIFAINLKKMWFVRKTLVKSQNLVHSQLFGDCQSQIYGILFNSDLNYSAFFLYIFLTFFNGIYTLNFLDLGQLIKFFFWKETSSATHLLYAFSNDWKFKYILIFEVFLADRSDSEVIR